MGGDEVGIALFKIEWGGHFPPLMTSLFLINSSSVGLLSSPVGCGGMCRA